MVVSVKSVERVSLINSSSEGKLAKSAITRLDITVLCKLLVLALAGKMEKF